MQGEKQYKTGLDVGSTTAKIVIIDESGQTVFSRYERHNAQVNDLLSAYFREARQELGDIETSIAVTGSVGMGTAEQLRTEFIQEVVARHPVRPATISICFGFDRHRRRRCQSRSLSREPYRPSHERELCRWYRCVYRPNGRTVGSNIEELSDWLCKQKHIHPIAARCGVFSKTDIQNLVSRKRPRWARSAASIFHAVAVQTIVTLSRGSTFHPPILLCGGPLTFIPALRKAFADYLHLQESDFILPAGGNLLPALGCALCATEGKAVSLSTLENLISRSTNITTKNSLPPLFDSETDYDNWKKEKAHYNWPSAPLVQGIQEAVLGIDSGSTTTKIVVTTPDGAILFSHYAPNLGNPIEAVRKGLTELKTQCDKNGTVLNITGSCSTGYGEELIKAAFGLDGSMIETMAHYRAARQMAPDVSFILDIGGQDMKAIFVKQGAITRMELNEACSSDAVRSSKPSPAR